MRSMSPAPNLSLPSVWLHDKSGQKDVNYVVKQLWLYQEKTGLNKSVVTNWLFNLSTKFCVSVIHIQFQPGLMA